MKRHFHRMGLGLFWGFCREQTSRNCIFIVFLVGAGVLWGSSAWADERVPPIVLFLALASEHEAAQLEREISSEIALTLTNFKVVTRRENSSFIDETAVSKRTAILKQMAAANNAVAVVWVQHGPHGILLHLAALSKDQAVVRIAETEESADAPGVLALIVQEFLELTYLFENQPNVAPRTSDASPKPIEQRPKNDDDYPVWSVVLSAGMGGGLVSYKGSAQKFIGSIAVERTFDQRWYLFPEIRFLLSPEQMEADFSHESIGGAIGLGAGYKFRFNRFVLSPQITVGAVWQKFDVRFENSQTNSVEFFSAYVDFSLRFQWSISRAVFLAVSPGAVLNITQKYFHDSSNNVVVYTNPRVEWKALGTLGINF